MLNRKVLSFVLMLAVVLSVVGCQKNPGGSSSVQSSKPLSSQSSDDSQEANNEGLSDFKEFTDGWFKTLMSENVFSANYTMSNPKSFGVTYSEDSDDLASSYTEEARLKSLQQCKDMLEDTKKFDREKLNGQEQILYDIIIHDMTLYTENSDLYYYDEPLKPMSNSAVDMVFTISNMRTYGKEENIDIILDLYDEVDEYLDELIKFEKKRSELGLFMQPAALDKVVSQVDEFIALGEKNYVLTAFDESLDSVAMDDTKKSKYRAEMNETLFDDIYPAYKEFNLELRKLKGTHKTDGRISELPEGKRYFEYSFENVSGSDRTQKDTLELAYTQIKQAMVEISKIAEKNPEAISHYINAAPDSYKPQAIIDSIIQQMKDDFPEIDVNNITFNPYPKSYESSGSQAMYFYPPIDDLSTNKILLNESILSEIDELSRFVTIGHEGFPGHMYQVNYFLSNNPLALRHVFSFTGYSEGWTRYTENYSMDYANFGSDDAVKFGQLNGLFTNYLYLILEIEIHYNGLNSSDLAKKLEFTGYEQDVIESLYQSLLQNPNIFTPYSVGFLELVNMRLEAEKSLGNKFDEKEFHKMYLDVGPAPFSVVHDAFNQYIANSKGEQETSSELKVAA